MHAKRFLDVGTPRSAGSAPNDSEPRIGIGVVGEHDVGNKPYGRGCAVHAGGRFAHSVQRHPSVGERVHLKQNGGAADGQFDFDAASSGCHFVVVEPEDVPRAPGQ